MISFRNEIDSDKPYSLDHGQNISVVIPRKVRYVAQPFGGVWKMYHAEGNVCNKMCDTSGFCMGHRMSLREFLNTYCNGKLPEELKE